MACLSCIFDPSVVAIAVVVDRGDPIISLAVADHLDFISAGFDQTDDLLLYFHKGLANAAERDLTGWANRWCDCARYSV